MFAEDRRHREVLDLINVRLNRLERLIMTSAQSEIDAFTDQLNTLREALTSDQSAIQAKLTELEEEITTLQGQGVDTTALKAAADALSSEVDNISALVPAAPPATGDGGSTQTGDDSSAPNV